MLLPVVSVLAPAGFVHRTFGMKTCRMAKCNAENRAVVREKAYSQVMAASFYHFELCGA